MAPKVKRRGPEIRVYVAYTKYLPPTWSLPFSCPCTNSPPPSRSPNSPFHFPFSTLFIYTPIAFSHRLFVCLSWLCNLCVWVVGKWGLSKCKDLCNTCPEDPRPSVDCITLTHFIWPSSIFPYLAESALCVSPLIISSRFLLCIFSEEKMSLNPNGYKLSERTGKLTAYGEYLFEFKII